MKDLIKREIIDMNNEILKHMEKLKGYKIMIYPFNQDSIDLKEILESKLGIHVDFFCDDSMPSGKCSSDVMLFRDILEYRKSHNVSVFCQTRKNMNGFMILRSFKE